MNQTTVTMPMSEYEELMKDIEKLERERVTNFLETEWISLEKDQYSMSVDMDKVNEYLDKHYPTRQKAVVTVGPSEYVIPKQRPLLIRMTCMDCGREERSKFTRIRSCPECNGVVVDVWEKDILNKVLDNAGYIRVSDMNVNDVLSMAVKEIEKYRPTKLSSFTSYGIDYAKPE